jgi:ParB-like chromosome segregation protein Spo0J
MTRKISITDIVIGERHRKDLGDLVALAESIKIQGLLQPIGITSECEMVFGYRRLLACRDHLGWTEIEVREVNVTSILDGEHDENEIRKDFTISERVAIKKALEEKIKKRHGNRYMKVESEKSHLLRRSEFIASKSGLGSTTTAREAERVVDEGIPALVDAMDSKDIGVEHAAVIAREPKENQAVIMTLPVPDRRERANQLAVRQRQQRAAGRTAKKTQKPAPPPRIIVPYQKLETASDEETQKPPPGSPFEVIAAWRDKIGSKVPLFSMNGKELLEARTQVREFGLSLTKLVNPHSLDADTFFTLVDRMLAHQPKHGTKSGEQFDFAASAREILEMLQDKIDAVIQMLEIIKAGLPSRTANDEPVSRLL